MGDISIFTLNISALSSLFRLGVSLLVLFVAARAPLKRKYHYVFMLFLAVGGILQGSSFVYGQLSDNPETYANRVWWTWFATYLREPLLYLFILLFVSSSVNGVSRYTFAGVCAYSFAVIGMLLVDPSLIYTSPRSTPIGFASRTGSLIPYLDPFFGISSLVLIPALLGPAALIHRYRSQKSTVVRGQIKFLLVGMVLFAVGYLAFSLGRYTGGINPRTFFDGAGMVALLVGLRKHGFSAISPVPEIQSKVPLRYNLSQKFSYLSLEPEPKQSLEVFSNLALNENHGLCITRTPPSEIRET